MRTHRLVLLTGALLCIACGPAERSSSRDAPDTEVSRARFPYAPAVVYFETYQAGEWRRRARRAFAYDKKLRLIEERDDSRKEDPGAEGWKPQTITRHTFKGDRPEAKTIYFADGPAWEPEYRFDYKFEKDRLQSLAWSSFRAGNWVASHRYAYEHEDEGLSRFTGYSIDDEQPRERAVFTRGSEGSGRLEQVEWFDRPEGEFRPDGRVTYGYEDERMTRLAHHPKDGAEETKRSLFSYTDAGLVETWTVLSRKNGSFEEESRTVFEYDEQGRLASTTEELALNGDWEPRRRRVVEMTTEGDSQSFAFSPPEATDEYRMGLNPRLLETYGHVSTIR